MVLKQQFKRFKSNWQDFLWLLLLQMMKRWTCNRVENQSGASICISRVGLRQFMEYKHKYRMRWVEIPQRSSQNVKQLLVLVCPLRLLSKERWAEAIGSRTTLDRKFILTWREVDSNKKNWLGTIVPWFVYFLYTIVRMVSKIILSLPRTLASWLGTKETTILAYIR